MSDFHSINPLVWPQPPSGHQYAESTFGGNSYVSTGFFAPGSLGFNGQGKEVSNLTGLCSYLFDADLIDLVDAWRIAHGQTLEGKVAERKKWIYDNLDDAQVETLKASLRDAVEDALLPLMDFAPTLTVDSGWGWHFYYAFGESLRDPSHLQGLQELHKRIVAAVNAEIATKAESILGAPGIFDSALDQATNDVGTRISRIPGTMNVKCSTRHKPCQVVDSDDETVLGFDDVAAIIERLPAAQQGSQGAKKTSKKVKVKSPAAPVFGQAQAPSPIKTMDFAILSFQGQSLFDLAMSLNPGEQTDIICPFGGTSVGSAFVAKGTNGAIRLHSNAMGTTFFHEAAQSVAPPLPAAAPAPAQRTLAVLTRRVLQNGALGAIENSLDNLTRLLMSDSVFDFWTDTFRHQLMNGEKLVDLDLFYIDVMAVMSADYGWRWMPGKSLIMDLVKRIGVGNGKNPVQDYIKGLKWDGEERLSQWIDQAILEPARVAGCPELPDATKDLYAAYSLRWGIQLVARAMEPGCIAQTTLVLFGKQGFGKQHIWRSWSPFRDLFVDTPVDLRSKDKYLTIQKAWIYEDAEMSSGTKAQEEAKKAFLSSAEDTFRAPYSEKMQTVKRSSVIVGSTNEKDFLRDGTGSRRYWVVECPRLDGLSDFDPAQPTANYQWIADNREQLLAEAYHHYKAGVKWYLELAEDEARHNANKEDFTHETEWDNAASLVYAANKGGVKNAITPGEFARAADPSLTTDKLRGIGYALRNALLGAGFALSPNKKNCSKAYYKLIPKGTVAMSGNGLGALDVAGVVNPGWGYTKF